MLNATAKPGDAEIKLTEPVQWPVDSRIVIATTDFESPMSSHTELATVAGVRDNGRTVQLKDVRVCPRFTFSGIPMDCTLKVRKPVRVVLASMRDFVVLCSCF